MRPPGRDGQGEDRRGRVPALELIGRYSTREVTELRFPVGVQETLDGQLDGLGERIERLPDRVLVYSDDGEAVAAAAHAARPAARDGPRPHAARWRTCSCASPAGASWTDGRRAAGQASSPGPPPTGDAVPRRRALDGARAAYEHQLLLYLRTWRGSIFGNFAQPVLFLLAMGVGLGSFVDRAGSGVMGGVPYLQFLAPALLASSVMQGSRVRGDVPGAGGLSTG